MAPPNAGGAAYCPACVFALRTLVRVAPSADAWGLYEQYMATPDPAIMERVFALPPDTVAAMQQTTQAVLRARAGVVD